METISNLTLVDSNSRRRAGITHALCSSGIHVEPCESIAELAGAWPRAGVILIHDEGDIISQLIETMARHGEWFPIVAYGENPTAHRIVRAVLDGAVDYIAWPVTVDELTSTFAGSAQRAGSVSNARLREIMARSRIERLTRREREVLGGVASGLSNRMIGERLAISPRTVEIHRANMLHKLGATHTSDAIRIAIEASLVH